LVYFGPGCVFPLTGTNFAAGLWYVPGADNGSLLLTPTGGTQPGALAFFRVATTSMPGVWNNGAAGNTRTLDGVVVGTYATLQVRVWDITKYSAFALAFAANDYGWSTPFNYRAPIPTDPATASYMEGFRGINACPEPATVALGLLAAGAWLLTRRRPAR
jgi:uncharacterized protein (TIGR03382 family)